MLTKKTFLATDSYGGIGLFANEDIKKSEILWVWNDFTDKVIKESEIKDFPIAFQEFLEKYGYKPREEFGKNVIFINLDNGRFFNHSDNPSTIELEDGTIIASKDLKKGDEITCNYLLIDPKKEFCAKFLR